LSGFVDPPEGDEIMRPLVLAFALSFNAAVPAFAQASNPAPAQAPAQSPAPTISPTEAQSHAGQSVTVEGTVSNVHKIPNGITFIDMGGKFPENTFTAVILAADAAKFPEMTSLNGKTVDVTGEVRLYKGKPEILLKDPAQIKAK
jgi:DNA/RNA endonuclease YhcR with UshA esterase domain